MHKHSSSRQAMTATKIGVNGRNPELASNKLTTIIKQRKAYLQFNHWPKERSNFFKTIQIC